MAYAGTDRRVRKLSLTVTDASHSRRVAGLVEEALRLASIPGESEGRYYQFRRLRLGNIRSDESASLIALRLESEFLRFASGAVAIADPRAQHADGIYFRSALEPLRFALVRLGRGLPLDVWFLRAILPRLSLVVPRVEVLRQLLEASAELLGGPVNTAYLLDDLLSHGELEPLLPSLSAETTIALVPSLTRVAQKSGLPKAHLPTAWIRIVQQALSLWGPDDVRPTWLVWNAILAQAPARISDPELTAKARATVRESAAEHTIPSTKYEQETVEQESFEDKAKSEASAPHHAPDSTSRSFTANLLAQSARVSTQTLVTEEAEAEPVPAPFSRHCGFLFLLHVLTNLGMEEFLSSRTELLECNFPWLVLRVLASHLRIDDDDPHWSLAPPLDPDDLQNRVVVSLPAAWRELLPRWLDGQPNELTASKLARLWAVAVQRWLWRHGGLRLKDVVRKRGQVVFARPQVDVKLLLNEVDIRVRRLGLDLDPGWVTWLGLIVRFHYVRYLEGTDDAHLH